VLDAGEPVTLDAGSLDRAPHTAPKYVTSSTLPSASSTPSRIVPFSSTRPQCSQVVTSSVVPRTRKAGRASEAVCVMR
jgi:hypothetical protein